MKSPEQDFTSLDLDAHQKLWVMLPPHSLCCAHDVCIHHEKWLDGFQGPLVIVLRCHIDLFWRGPFRNNSLATQVSCEFMHSHLAGRARNASETQVSCVWAINWGAYPFSSKAIDFAWQTRPWWGVCLALSSNRNLPFWWFPYPEWGLTAFDAQLKSDH
jgi:hypothetical protein